MRVSSEQSQSDLEFFCFDLLQMIKFWFVIIVFFASKLNILLAQSHFLGEIVLNGARMQTRLQYV